MIKEVCWAIGLCVATPVFADEAKPSNFRVVEQTLIFDTEKAGTLRDISTEHIEEIRSVLRANPKVTNWS